MLQHRFLPRGEPPPGRIQPLRTSAKFFPLVPLGVWLGVWLNRRFSETAFVQVIYVILLVTGLQLICNFDLAAPFR